MSKLNIGYERAITPKISLFVGYTRIPFYFNGSKLNASKHRNITTEEYDTDTNSIGKLHERYNFNYWDAGFVYKILDKKQHVLQIMLGASIANGTNTYKTNLVLSFPSPEGWIDVINLEKDHKKEMHFGGVLGIGYHYKIFKDKVSVGAHTNTRIYNKGFPFQINYGLSLGYNF